MMRLLLYSVLTVVLLNIYGCTPPPRTPPRASIEGIKLSDLAPTVSTKHPSEIHFRILTFELPAEKSEVVSSTFADLRRTSLDFESYYAFRKNGFTAGSGQANAWNRVADKLRRASAKKIKTDTLLVFDDAGDDIDILRINSPRTIFYTNTNQTMTGVTLERGHLALRLAAWPVPEMKGTIDLKFLPAFRPHIDAVIARITGKQGAGDIEFASNGFQMKMGVGDFVLLGPDPYDPDQATLASLFFNFTAEALVYPEKTDEQDASIQIFPVTTEIPVIRLYLIFCTGLRL